jgi:hypothetical protein
MVYLWMRRLCSIFALHYFSDGAGGCFEKGKSDAEWLHCSIVAEAEAVQQSKCTI